MKYKGKNYQVKSTNCKKLVDICFVPFSGNGVPICRLWEMGTCPTEDKIQELIKLWKKEQKAKNQ